MDHFRRHPTMAFPALLFIIALSSSVGDSLNSVTFGVFDNGVVLMFVVFSAFGWFFPARIVRALVLSLRERESIDAARMTGASDLRIMRSHILPHLIAPLTVLSTLFVASFILGEAGLSFLGVGIKLPAASWGNLLQQAAGFYTVQPWLMLWPGLAVLITTLSFSLNTKSSNARWDPARAEPAGVYRMILKLFVDGEAAVDAKYSDLTAAGYVSHAAP